MEKSRPHIFNFDNTYSNLPDTFYQKVDPTPVSNPELILFNQKLADQLTNTAESSISSYSEDLSYLNFSGYSKTTLGEIFSGNQLLSGSSPIAQAYAGHQFGHFVPQLGDGRAILLGEVVNQNTQKRFDIQLKGSGLTAFSRGGDGRAPLGPMIREYVVSEAMHSLGIPTTRALALVSTGERVERDISLPGAILTRIAASHIRVGTFEYFASRYDFQNLKLLADYSIQRHFPEALQSSNPYLEFLKSVIQKQASLIAKWMSVGFVHGVMNTDNMTISGETIDYGPCAFIDYYKSDAVFSSIDKRGRYAFSNQSKIAEWNLSVLASCLVPLISFQQTQPAKNINELSESNETYTKEIIEQVQTEVDKFDEIYQIFWIKNMRQKLGISILNKNSDSLFEQDKKLIVSFLQILEDQSIDFTFAFRLLSDTLIKNLDETKFYKLFYQKNAIDSWLNEWKQRLALDKNSIEAIKISMDKINPSFIPRSHLIAKVIESAMQGNLKPLNELRITLSKPYEDPDLNSDYLFNPPKEHERVVKTFCGT